MNTDQEAAPIPRHRRPRGLNNDRIYIAAIAVVWVIAELLFAYKTLPGGIGMLPMFLFMTCFNFSVCLWIWRNRDAF